MDKISARSTLTAGPRSRAWLSALIFTLVLSLLLVRQAEAQRRTKMPDINQKALPEWGNNWCAPASVANSFLWLAQEYPDLGGLVRIGGVVPMSGTDVANVLGSVDMNTSPTGGTTAANVEAGKKSYIERHGLKDKISVETKKEPSKNWIKQQYDKGQDVEIGFGFYQWDSVQNKYMRTGGHQQVFGDVPGSDVGGHSVSLVDLEEIDGSEDFLMTFTDPGRDDLTGDYGAIGHEQYWLTDPVGNDILCTASTYHLSYAADPFGDGIPRWSLDNYGGAGETWYGGPPPNGQKVKVLEYAWAESPIPEPGSLLAMSGGLMALARFAIRRRR